MTTTAVLEVFAQPDQTLLYGLSIWQNGWVKGTLPSTPQLTEVWRHLQMAGVPVKRVSLARAALSCARAEATLQERFGGYTVLEMVLRTLRGLERAANHDAAAAATAPTKR